MQILAWPKDKKLNPYTGLIYSHLPADAKTDGWPGNLLRKYDVWHVHWPDALLGIPNPVHAAYKVSAMFVTMDYLKRRGTRIVWTMHNFASHEGRHPRLEKWFWRQFIPHVDGAISLSHTGLAMGLEKFPRLRSVPTAVIPHGHYRTVCEPSDKARAREILGIAPGAKVIAFFGAVRAYKNVDALVRLFREVRDPDAVLFVAGDPNRADLAAAIEKEAAPDPRVRLRFAFVSDEEAGAILGAADLVVLPYREILHSGSAMLALSCNRPIVVPGRGSMGELQEEFGEDWVKTYRGELTAEILEESLEWGMQPRPAICPMPEKYDWASIGAETLRFFQQVASPGATIARKGSLPVPGEPFLVEVKEKQTRAAASK